VTISCRGVLQCGSFVYRVGITGGIRWVRRAPGIRAHETRLAVPVQSVDVARVMRNHYRLVERPAPAGVVPARPGSTIAARVSRLASRR